jgi:dTDP-4-amino-4,6-dideoxygalactose transaminase
VAAALRPSADAEARLADALRARIPGDHVFLFGSGRAALAALLRSLRELREGDGVVVPAYTCWSVPAAIVRAGLRVLPVDMKPGEIDFDFEPLARLDWRGVLAIISPNLFGLPGDLTQLEGLAEDHGIVLIDDAAQCLGAAFDGRAVGAFGHAAIVSFGRGKNVTALGGGAALVRDPQWAEALRSLGDEFRNEAPPNPWRLAAKAGTMRMALSPSWYGFAESLPGVTVGRTIYDPNFATPAFGAARAAIAVEVLGRLDEVNQRRAQQAAWLDRTLGQLNGVVLPRVRSGATPAWLRRPILTREAGKRDALLAALQQAGIGATAMYPAPVHRISTLAPDLDLRAAPFAGAQRLADNLIALPLVEGLDANDLQRIANVVTDIMGKRIGERWA